jgi:hypothetical protein
MKILFWLYLMTVGGGLAYLETKRGVLTYDLYVWAGFALLLVTLVGFYGAAYGKRIGPRLLWQVMLACDAGLCLFSLWFAVVSIPYTVGVQFQHEAWDSAAVHWLVVGAVGIPVMWATLPPLIALFLYVFRRPQIWRTL